LHAESSRARSGASQVQAKHQIATDDASSFFETRGGRHSVRRLDQCQLGAYTISAARLPLARPKSGYSRTSSKPRIEPLQRATRRGVAGIITGATSTTSANQSELANRAVQQRQFCAEICSVGISKLQLKYSMKKLYIVFSGFGQDLIVFSGFGQDLMVWLPC
jgi:hypothetical protein